MTNKSIPSVATFYFCNILHSHFFTTCFGPPGHHLVNHKHSVLMLCKTFLLNGSASILFKKKGSPQVGSAVTISCNDGAYSTDHTGIDSTSIDCAQEIMLGGVPVPTAWRVLGLRMEERPPDMEVSCEYIE
jgi:hypothetical protein